MVSELNIYQRKIFNRYYNELAVKTDRIFFWLFFFQWLAGILCALYQSPVTVADGQLKIHIHIYLAVFGGALLSSFPMYLTSRNPGAYLNRFVVAAAQIGYSILLTHLTSGRIETHFHIFVSLAFLASYRDFRPIIVATVITSLDHLLRGIYVPESVYGVLSASPLRAVEHAGWVVFEDFILYHLIKNGVAELKTIARNQATIENNLLNVEKLVALRTQELVESQARITEQQQPLAIISIRVDQLRDSVNKKEYDAENFLKGLQSIKITNDRIAKIVKGLSFFSRNGKHTPSSSTTIASIIEDTMSLCKEKFKNHGIVLKGNFLSFNSQLAINCRPVEISQVLLNLLNNSFDAIMPLEEKWISMEITQLDTMLEIAIVDSGSGIPEELRQKIFNPFFTTKEIGKGTGLGLSISKGIIEEHKGTFHIDSKSPNTKFVIRIPLTECSQVLCG